MILTDLVLPIRYTESDLISLIGKHMRREPVRSFRILKRSIDARKKPDLKFVITVAVNADQARLAEPSGAASKRPAAVTVS